MRYTDDLIEEVLSRNDIVDVISGYVRLQRKGTSWFGLCPFHNEKSPSFSVSQEKQLYYCFGCGNGGNVYTFLMKYENYTFQEAIQFLADRAGIKLPEADYSEAEKRDQDKKALLREANKLAAAWYYRKLRTPQGRQAMDYLKGRGLSDEIIHQFGLGAAGKYSNEVYQLLKQKGYRDDLLRESGLVRYDEKTGASDRFWNRVMFPIMDANSRVIGFGGRVMGEGKPKYLNSPETPIFDKSRNLYGLHIARRTRRNFFIICEGYMDVISMHQAGYTNAVASLGTALTSQQCSLISRFTRNVLVIYDMDEAGTKAALRAIPMLRDVGLAAKVVNLKPHKDPDEFIKAEGAQAFEKRLDEAENSFLFEIRLMERDFDLGDPQGQSEFLHRVAARLVSLGDEIERETYLRALARRYRVEEEVLSRQVKKQALSGTGLTEIRIKSPSAGRERKLPRANSVITSQKLMLTWIADMPSLAQRLSGYLSPEDFITPLYREVAGMVFDQAGRGRVSPASIINHFPGEEDQTEVASVFHTALTLESDQEKEKALTDVFFQLKFNSIQARMQKLDPADLQGLMKLTEEKQRLDQLRGAGLASLRLFS